MHGIHTYTHVLTAQNMTWHDTAECVFAFVSHGSIMTDTAQHEIMRHLTCWPDRNTTTTCLPTTRTSKSFGKCCVSSTISAGVISFDLCGHALASPPPCKTSSRNSKYRLPQRKQPNLTRTSSFPRHTHVFSH